MIEIRRICNTDTADFHFIEELLTAAFPQEEYRQLSEFRRLTKEETRFHNNLIVDNDSPIGLITYWDLDRFCYVEHFAILPAMRNKGYGHNVLELLKGHKRLPIVLEVECPEEEMARRRIAFYQRQGFTLWQSEYLQPPYRPGDGFLPLRLMVHGELDENTCFPWVKQTIHQKVYFHMPTLDHTSSMMQA